MLGVHPQIPAGGVRVDVPQHRADHRVGGPGFEHPDRHGMTQRVQPAVPPGYLDPGPGETPGHDLVEVVTRCGRLVRGPAPQEQVRVVDVGALVLPVVDDRECALIGKWQVEPSARLVLGQRQSPVRPGRRVAVAGGVCLAGPGSGGDGAADGDRGGRLAGSDVPPGGGERLPGLGLVVTVPVPVDGDAALAQVAEGGIVSRPW